MTRNTLQFTTQVQVQGGSLNRTLNHSPARRGTSCPWKNKSYFSVFGFEFFGVALFSPEILVCRPRSKGRDEELEHDAAGRGYSMKRMGTLHEENGNSSRWIAAKEKKWNLQLAGAHCRHSSIGLARVYGSFWINCAVYGKHNGSKAMAGLLWSTSQYSTIISYDSKLARV